MDFSLEKKQLIKLNAICKSKTEKTTVQLSKLGIKNPSNTMRYFETMIINHEQQQAPVFTNFEINDDSFTYSLSELFCQFARNGDKWVIEDFIKSPTGEPTQIYLAEQSTDQQNTKSKLYLFSAIASFVLIGIVSVIYLGTDTKKSISANEYIQANVSLITDMQGASVDEISRKDNGNYVVSVSFPDDEITVNENYELKLGAIDTETDHSFTILYSKKITN